MSSSTQMDRAQREVKEEAVRAEKLAKMQARYAMKGDSNFFDSPPPPPPAPVEEGAFVSCLKCMNNGSPTPAVPPPARRGSTKGRLADDFKDYGDQLEADLKEQQTIVQRDRDKVQKAFSAVAKFDPVEAATRLGSEKSASVRKQMWELLCAQVESGLGTPTEEQLSALWSKYDGNSDGNLSLTEMRQMVVDHSAAMHARLSKHLPVFQKRLLSGAGALNPFVELITRAFMYECEAQLAMHRAQSEGRITQAQLSETFRTMDTSHDGRITRDEFMAKATGTFFSSLLEEVTNEAMVASMSAAAADAKTAKPSFIFQSLEKAEREASLAQKTVDDAHKRMRQFTEYTKRLKEDRDEWEHEIEKGAQTLVQKFDDYTSDVKSVVRRDGATTLVQLELAISGGTDETARTSSVKMFEILSKQLAAGMGKPNEEQLAALWKRYDEDGNGSLSRGELGHLITDYATARAGEIKREEIPLLEKILETEGSNQFVCLLTRARLMAKEAELALFVAQAEGQLADADLKNAFAALDANHDVSLRTSLAATAYWLYPAHRV
jgi:Ca2+-binding EF-hand superfamily protein